ncbi:hypothetical protein ACIO6U_03055 [Streptomyces sp. NPDC087422]|uniref:hypothetical protein n=1 Tax=Streptomyces sp. NPDC087422 TaxID=3365786 RepID=UPI0038198384
MTADLTSTARLDVPVAEVTTLVDRLRLSLPLDDPDRHDLDPLDGLFAHLAPGYPVSGGAA